jgi:hypothetical protein
MKLITRTLLILLVPLVMSCSTSLDDYQDTSPEFSLPAYFDGEVTAWGIVQDYSTKLSRRFCVDIVGTWEGNKGQLHETFYYNDGEQQVRIWDLTIAPDGEVTGGAADVIGQASGRAKGSAFNWQYTLRVPIDDTTYDLFVDDWMYLMDENRLMNRSYMKKFGVTVAEISIFFDKSPPLRKCR